MHRPTLAFCALIAAPVAFAQRPLFEALHEPLAQGGAQFAPRVLAAADFDGDGAVDALTEDGVRLGDGAGRFATIAPSSTELRSAQRAVVGDFDGDGDPDVVALRGFLGTSLLLNDGTGGLFVAGAPLPLAGHEAAVAGDFDGDGDDDLAIGQPGEDLGGDGRGGVTVVTGEPIGGLPGYFRFLSPGSSGLPGSSQNGQSIGMALAAGDFDDNGHLDLVLGAPYSDVAGIGADVGAEFVLYGALFADGFDGNSAIYWSATLP